MLFSRAVATMMRILQGAVVLLLALFVVAVVTYRLLQPPAPLALPPPGAALKSVVLIVPGEGRTGPVDLTVTGGIISHITPSEAPHVSAYVLPGLVDAHMHGPMLPFPREEELYAFLNLYHGVTGARMAAGDAGMRDAISQGRYPGPKMVTCGPFIDGEPPLWRSSLVVVDADSARQVVDHVRQAGFDCLKVYNELTADASQALYLHAAVAGLPVIGHVPWRQDATQAWIDDQQHLLGLAPRATGTAGGAWEGGAGRPSEHVRAMLRLGSVDARRIRALADSMTETGVALTPTLITLQRKFKLQDYEALRASAAALLMPAYYRDHLWHPRRGLVSARVFSAQDHDQFRRVYPDAQAALRGLYAQGVSLRTGTDAPAEFIVPGAGLVEELTLLIDAGFTPEQVLQMSSVESARALFGDSAGQLLIGSPADFVVYAADPTAKIGHLDTRLAVVRDGRLYSRAALEQQLQAYERWFNSPLYAALSSALVRAMLALVAWLS